MLRKAATNRRRHSAVTAQSWAEGRRRGRRASEIASSDLRVSVIHARPGQSPEGTTSPGERQTNRMVSVSGVLPGPIVRFFPDAPSGRSWMVDTSKVDLLEPDVRFPSGRPLHSFAACLGRVRVRPSVPFGMVPFRSFR
jgi:hypothetical protein